MTQQRIERTHYFAGEALLTDDFITEQNYNMAMLRNHNRSLHTYGIARGLEVAHDTTVDATQVEIAPGTAIDRLGREIILLERLVLRLRDPEPGRNYYLTITYDEVYGDYTDQSGVPGYKRIIQKPRINCELNLQDPGLHLLLAVIGLSSESRINHLTYKFGSFERRYVGSVLGTVAFITEGSGVALDGEARAVPLLSSEGMLEIGNPAPAGGYASISARRESSSAGQQRDYLLVDAPRTQFSGLATTRNNLGIGVDQPLANLQLDAITFKGPGTLSSNGQQVTLTEPPQPFFQVGDVLISDPMVTQAAQTRTITAINPQCRQVTVDTAFHPPLANAPYTYVRALLASFSSASAGPLLQVGCDGTVGLGGRYAVRSGLPDDGLSALVITPDRKVGIGLATTGPQAELDVNGVVHAAAANIDGKVIAGSFEGNGSKLVGLPILSFWTQESPGQPNSKLNYMQGNVGIRASNSPGSLGVGGGQATIGSGLIKTKQIQTVEGRTTAIVQGYQTQLHKEVSVGDSITIGELVPMPLTVTQVATDLGLTVDTQPQFVLYNAQYQTRAANGAVVQGQGTISSNGTAIVGVGTHFKAVLQQGDQLIVPQFKLAGADPVSWMVQAVDAEQQQMTLAAPAGASQFDANNSAFVVAQALLAQFKSTDTSGLVQTPVPAMLVQTNSTAPSPNTVAINVEIGDVDPAYALQVNGDVSFSSNGGTTTRVQTLIATRNILVDGDGTAAQLLQVGEHGATPLLVVTPGNVVLGQASGDAKYLLDAAGSIHSSQNIVGDKVVQGGTLQGSNLDVSGCRIDAQGSVQILGTRSGPWDETHMTSAPGGVSSSFSQLAATDGHVLATVGRVQQHNQFFGFLEGATTDSSGAPTSYTYAGTLCYPYTAGGGKKSSGTTYYPTLPGSFTLPVRAGETWTLTLNWLPSGAGMKPPGCEFYWVPLGTVQTGGALLEEGPQERGAAVALGDAGGQAPLAGPAGGPGVQSSMQAAMAEFRRFMTSGDFERDSIQAAQRNIDQRVGDLAQVFGDATAMSASPDDRAAFIKDLQNIVCSAAPPGQVPDNAVDPRHIQDLIDTFGRVTGHSFTAQQRELLASGVQALVRINDNDENRHDLNLIKNNINHFLEAVGQAIGKAFGANERRLLTRALVRLVGDGSQAAAAGGADASGTPPADQMPGDADDGPAEGGGGGGGDCAGEGGGDARAAAVDDFLRQVGQALGTPLDEAGRGSLQQVVSDILARQPAREQASTLLVDGVAAIAGEPMAKAAQGRITRAVGKLLDALG